MEMWPAEGPHLHDHDSGAAATAVLAVLAGLAELAGLMGGEVSVRER